MGNRIRELRKQRGYTMKELGHMLGLAESTVSQYENCKRQPDNETLLKLSEIFNTTVGYIIGAEEEQPEEPEEGAIKAAFFNGIDPSVSKEEQDEMWAEAQDYMRFKMQQRRKEKND